MAPEDFVEALSKAPGAALGELIERDYSERSFDEPSWDDALSLIRQVVETRPRKELRSGRWQMKSPNWASKGTICAER